MTLSRTSALAALVLALAACCGPKNASKPDPGPGGGPTGDDVGAIDLSKLGTPCGEADSCSGGTKCTTYYGIAGPSGPAFKSCEIQCVNGKGPCPTGTACVTIADGPGAVCRVTDAPEGPPIDPSAQ